MPVAWRLTWPAIQHGLVAEFLAQPLPRAFSVERLADVGKEGCVK